MTYDPFGPRGCRWRATPRDSAKQRTTVHSYTDAARKVYLDLLRQSITPTRQLDPSPGLLALNQFAHIIEIVDQSLYEEHEAFARERVSARRLTPPRIGKAFNFGVAIAPSVPLTFHEEFFEYQNAGTASTPPCCLVGPTKVA
jgi:hypothetical protein